MREDEQLPLRAFLCHASEDKARVRGLYDNLLRDGIDPWLDAVNLLGGQDWKLEIRRAVRSADAIIVCLSNQAVTKEGYVQRELRMALDVAEEKPPGTIFLIPVRLEACELPDHLGDIHRVDLFGESEDYDGLLKTLRDRARALGRRLPQRQEIRYVSIPECKPASRELQQMGINLLKVPRTSLGLPFLFTRGERNLESVGSLNQVVRWIAPAQVPTSRVLSKPSMQGFALVGNRCEVAVLYLNSFMRSLGGTTGDWAHCLNGAHRVNIGLVTAWMESVDLDELDEALRHADYVQGPALLQLLDATETYLAVDLLRSHSLSLEAFGKSGDAIEIDVPRLQEALGPYALVQASARKSLAVLTIENAVSIGFRAIGVAVGDTLTIERPVPVGRSAIALDPSASLRE